MVKVGSSIVIANEAAAYQRIFGADDRANKKVTSVRAEDLPANRDATERRAYTALRNWLLNNPCLNRLIGNIQDRMRLQEQKKMAEAEIPFSHKRPSSRPLKKKSEPDEALMLTGFGRPDDDRGGSRVAIAVKREEPITIKSEPLTCTSSFFDVIQGLSYKKTESLPISISKEEKSPLKNITQRVSDFAHNFFRVFSLRI